MSEIDELFPQPRHVDRFDADVRCSAPVEVVHDPSLPEQGYEVHVTADRAVLTHADDDGRRYGEQTLDQLRADDGTLPAVDIRDHPDIAVRGAMLDVSRDRVPTRSTLERLVGILAAARYNHLQLYVEHTFAYRDHEDVWRDASPLTVSDMEWLDDLCEAHGIELVTNQNSFGHMGRWLALDRYRPRAECPDGVEIVPGVRWPPGVLAPTEENAAFALDLVREQMAAVRSRTVNIGCDETFELGRGASASRVAEVGLGIVYGEHLARLVRPLLEHGCAVQVWADVLAHHPDARALLPEGDVTALVWNYDPPGAPVPELRPRQAALLDALGIDLAEPADFASRLAPFADSGIATWVVPGTSSWNSLVGRLDDARANLLDAARAGAAAGVGGFLVTDWGDGGHHQPPSVSDPAWLYGGAVAWCAETNADLDVAAVVDRAVTGDATGTIGRVLDEIGAVHGRTGAVVRNASPLCAALFPHHGLMVGGTADPDAVREVIVTLERARDELARARPTAADGGTIVAELDVAIGLARHGALRMLGGAAPDELRADLAALIEPYREAWLDRSRPGGLADSVAHLERTLATYA
ncbi:glycoside hydrolase family 20 zincin-like fold domain-containing protein [Actinomarinicola tropica]|uniref:Glycoside hydrolase n=1 Tax=Actinomarinicola tropica TaxID=2789776 RepID=A0A5Q2RHI3_9ACTN|nr:glycoside hydrolase family 20 zincin-like fold domain-containing protein [Actinomarinicola tropica]QGG94332.1 glycoside hydrolase [Actinomarinicola tropica]